jgi:hypothetical protein
VSVICWVHVCVCRYLGGGDEGGEPILSLTQSYANSTLLSLSNILFALVS